MTASWLAASLLAAAVLVSPAGDGCRTRLARLLDSRPTGEEGAAGSAGWSVEAVRRASTGILVVTAVGVTPATLLGGVRGAVAVAMFGGAGVVLLRRASPRPGRLKARTAPATDPFRLAACWDLLAACLQAGLPVPVAVRAVSAELPAPAAEALRRCGDLMALGAGPVGGWAPALDHPDTAALATAARRTGRSGSALAAVAAELAREVRGRVADHAEARAQRASVLITGPLGLCFLPAFLCVGLVPVMVGLVSRLTGLGW